ncbi:MAG: adenosylmethionine decarboxylase [Deltaproteobacteria bacterium]|nr:adenosylmethionine decarboxylase [Deltaproteobacteria bacterium]
MHTLGRHLIAELYGCDPGRSDDLAWVRRTMLTATRKIGATIVGEVFHHFAPQGVTGSVVIAESHLSVHTWPESGYVSIDIFTCGALDPQPGFVYLAARFEAARYRIQEIARGTDADLDAGARLLPRHVRLISHITGVRRVPRVRRRGS